MAERVIQLKKTGGGSGTLDGGTLITSISGTNQYTFTSDYDLVLLLTGATGANNYRPTYNGVTYSWKEGAFGQTYTASAVLLQNVKKNTAVTFERNIVCSFYGYNYT